VTGGVDPGPPGALVGCDGSPAAALVGDDDAHAANPGEPEHLVDDAEPGEPRFAR
jgi:hypothetical protein